MDKVTLDRFDQSGRPLQIRSGHTPTNIGLLVGALLASALAFGFSTARSTAVNQALPLWATYIFYVVLFGSAALTLSAIWRPMPTHLDVDSFHVIMGKLARERVGLYGVSGIMACFAFSSIAAAGARGTTGASLLLGIGVGLWLRARQTAVDAAKLRSAMLQNDDGVRHTYVADPDDPGDGTRE